MTGRDTPKDLSAQDLDAVTGGGKDDTFSSDGGLGGTRRTKDRGVVLQFDEADAVKAPGVVFEPNDER